MFYFSEKNTKSKIFLNVKERISPLHALNSQSGKVTDQYLAKTTKNLGSALKAPFKVGETLVVKIHALGPNQLGLAQFTNGYTIVVPKVSLGDEIRVSIETISSGKAKYAIAKVVETLKKGQTSDSTGKESPVRAGEILDVTISKSGPKGSGLVEFTNNYTIIVPRAKVGDQMKIQITRVRQEYAFGKPVESSLFSKNSNSHGTRGKSSSSILSLKYSSTRSTRMGEDLSSALMKNSQFHLILPKAAKMYNGYAVVKLNGFIVFIKLALGAKLGDTVQIQTMKVGSNYAVAKILKVSPLSKSEKLMRTKSRVSQMIQTGLHFGEKAIRCNANMRKYVWSRKKGQNQNRPLLKKDRNYINVLKTRRCLQKALKQLAKYAAKGKTFLFVGTKKSASALIARTALFTKTSFLTAH